MKLGLLTSITLDWRTFACAYELKILLGTGMPVVDRLLVAGASAGLSKSLYTSRTSVKHGGEANIKKEISKSN
jgi:hypothetical protein